MYYLRTRPAADAIKFTVDMELLANKSNGKANGQDITPNKLTNPNGSPMKKNNNLESFYERINEFDQEFLPLKKSKKNGPERKILVDENGDTIVLETCFNCGS